MIESCLFSFRAVYLAMGSSVIANGLLVVLGLVAFAYYAYCDPLTSGQVSKADQVGHQLLPKCCHSIFRVHTVTRTLKTQENGTP